MDFDYARYMLAGGKLGKENNGAASTSQDAYQKKLIEVFNMNRGRILKFNSMPPASVDAFEHSSPSSNPTKSRRHIPKVRWRYHWVHVYASHDSMKFPCGAMCEYLITSNLVIGLGESKVISSLNFRSITDLMLLTECWENTWCFRSAGRLLHEPAWLGRQQHYSDWYQKLGILVERIQFCHIRTGCSRRWRWVHHEPQLGFRWSKPRSQLGQLCSDMGCRGWEKGLWSIGTLTKTLLF